MRTRRSGAGADDLADGVDVALHQVAAEAVLEADRSLEVDAVAGAERAEVGAGVGLVGHVGLPPAGSASKATTVRQQPLTAIESPSATPSSTTVAPMRRRGPSRAGHGPQLLDDAGEHDQAPDPTVSVAPWRRPSPGPPRAVGQVDAQVVAQPRHGHQPSAPGLGHGGGAGSGEQAAGVVAAEQSGRQVEHVAVDQARPVQVVGHRGAALDQHLEHAALARGRRARPPGVPLELERRVHPGVGRAPAEHDPERLAKPSGSSSAGRRTVSAGSSARTVPAPTSDGVAVGPQAVGVEAGRLAGDPLAGAVGRGGAPVEAWPPA